MADRFGWITDLPIELWAADGGTVIWIGHPETGPLALCSISDAPRPEARSVVSSLLRMDMAVTMLTGDMKATAEAVGRVVGISDVRAGLRPHDKISYVLSMKNVAMVGDGVNDVPALAAAQVGIAMGAAGRAAALEAADVVLMDSNLDKLVWAFRLGRKVVWKIRQNIFLSLALKLVLVICTFAGYASLWAAIVSDVGAMLVVTLNGTSLMLLASTHQKPKMTKAKDASTSGWSWDASNAGQSEVLEDEQKTKQLQIEAAITPPPLLLQHNPQVQRKDFKLGFGFNQCRDDCCCEKDSEKKARVPIEGAESIPPPPLPVDSLRTRKASRPRFASVQCKDECCVKPLEPSQENTEVSDPPPPPPPFADASSSAAHRQERRRKLAMGGAGQTSRFSAEPSRIGLAADEL